MPNHTKKKASNRAVETDGKAFDESEVAKDLAEAWGVNDLDHNSNNEVEEEEVTPAAAVSSLLATRRDGRRAGLDESMNKEEKERDEVADSLVGKRKKRTQPLLSFELRSVALGNDEDDQEAELIAKRVPLLHRGGDAARRRIETETDRASKKFQGAIHPAALIKKSSS